MLAAAILWIGLGAVGAGDYARPLGAKALDQAALDAEGFGDKKALKREDDGLRVTLGPGEPEAGWKTPPMLRIGGDFTITAEVVLRKLPKPGQEDGAAIGLALATQNIDQPEATLLREIEPGGADVYRPVDKGDPQAAMQMQMQMQMMFNPFGGGPAPPPKPPRHTFPARGATFHLELRRQGQTLHYQVRDDLASQPREIGQLPLGPGDVAGIKLFASNRNGAEPVDVLFRDLTVRADRIGGLGTAVRTVFGKVVLGDPTAIEAGDLVVGGPPPAPDPAALPDLPADVFVATTVPTPVPNPGVPVAAPAPPPAAVAVAPQAAVAVVMPQGAVLLAPQGAVVMPPGAVVAAPSAPEAAPGGPNPGGAPPAPAPKVRVPIDEVDSIAFERSSALAARYLGQPNVDTTMPGGAPPAPPKKAGAGDDVSAPPPGTVAPVKVPKVEPKPNGIRDLHLSLSGLRETAIRQVMVSGQSDKGPASWRLDTSDSQDAPLTLRRAGLEPFADLFLEPPAGDCRDKDLMIVVTYADNQPANAKVKVTGKTDPKLAFDPAAPDPPLDARVYLSGGEQLFGKLEGIGEDTLGLSAPWGDRLDIPLTRVVGVYMGMPDHKESPDSFAKRLRARGGEDLLLARAKDGEVVAIAGVVEGSKGNKLTFRYQDKGRTVPLKQVEGLVLAARPEPKPPDSVRPTFTLAGGIVVSGRWDAIGAEVWKVEAPWGQALKLPAADVRSVRFRGGRMSYLSDLEPSRVDETPYFGRRSPYRKDVNLAGEPLKLDGQAYERGLAVHSRSELTYDLDRRYATFEALVGFDDASKKKGRVDCRVYADAKELYANHDLRADAPPVKLSLPVAGADQLRLVVDFGADEDTGDRVIWANARLYRLPPRADAPHPSPTPTRPSSRP